MSWHNTKCPKIPNRLKLWSRNVCTRRIHNDLGYWQVCLFCLFIEEAQDNKMEFKATIILY